MNKVFFILGLLAFSSCGPRELADRDDNRGDDYYREDRHRDYDRDDRYDNGEENRYRWRRWSDR